MLTLEKANGDNKGEELVAGTPAVRDLAHLYDILWVEVQRARMEGRGALYLAGCTRALDRSIVDEQLRHILGSIPGCTVAAAEALSGGYSICLVRTADRDGAWTRAVEAPADRLLALHPC